MTSLQAQLAALNGSSGKHPGSILASSRRHEDAVGRGLHFRPEQGHAVTETIRFKASFIYETAQQAAKIPLRTLLEQAQAAATTLCAHDKPGTLLWDDWQLACSSTDASTETLQSILLHLSTWLGETDEHVVEQCLHILEYLLRRYNLHVSPTLWEDLLWCFLPHHATKAALVHRCLQLIDLGGSNQSYLFLRPYAATHTTPTPLPRALLAQHVMQTRNLLRRIVWMVRETCALVDDYTTASSTQDRPLRHGIQRHLSWTAACIVQGLAWQRHQFQSDGDREDVIRVLLPMVRQCCTMSSPDARMWGYLVASAAAETLDLASVVLEQWTSAMMEYAHDQPPQDDDGGSIRIDGEAWLALLSVLVPPQTGHHMVEDGSYLPLLQGGKWVGCPLPRPTFDSCLHQKGVTVIATALATLSQQGLQVTPLVAAFVARGLETYQVELVLALVHTNELKHVWKHPILKLAASVSSWVATLAAQQRADFRVTTNSEDPEERSEGSKIVTILQRLHEWDPLEAEQGYAHALQHATDNQTDQATIRKVLAQVVPSEVLTSPTNVSLPYVALNDEAHPSRRLEAIRKLLEYRQDTRETKQSLVDLLIRRWSHDRDFSVALALGTAIGSLIGVRDDSSQLWLRTEHASLILAGFHRWVGGPSSVVVDQKKKDGLFQSSLQMMQVALRELVCNEPETHLILEAGLAHVLDVRPPVSSAAQQVLVTALGETESLSHQDMLKALLVGRSSFLTRILERLKSDSMVDAGETVIREKSAWNLLFLCAQHPDSVETNHVAELCVDVACTLLESGTSNNTRSIGMDQRSKIVTCMQACAPHLSSCSVCISALMRIASLPDKDFEAMGQDLLKAVLHRPTNSSSVSPVSPVSIVMEASLQPTLHPSNICRLIDLASDYATNDESPVLSFSAIIPVLSLLEHDSERVRLTAIAFLEQLGQRYGDSSFDSKSYGDLKGLKYIFRDVFASLGTEGQSRFLKESLADVLSLCVKHKRGSESRVAMMRLCNLTCQSVDKLNVSKKIPEYLSPKECPRTIETVSTILKAMEVSGEEHFPLLERWNRVGVHVIAISIDLADKEVVQSYSNLFKTTVRMLRARYVTGSKVVFSSGPRMGGGRGRSYSLGSMEDVKTLESYPGEMSSAIISVLESKSVGALKLSSFVLKDLFQEAEWVDRVFSKLPLSARERLLTAVVDLVASDASDVATSSFLKLPFEAADVHVFLQNQLKASPIKLSLIVCVASFVSGNGEQMRNSTSFPKLFESLLAVLISLDSTSHSYEKEDYAYGYHALLNCLNMLSNSSTLTGVLSTNPSKKMLEGFSILRSIFDHDEDKYLNTFSYNKIRLTALSLTASLADTYPTETRTTLLDGLKACITHSSLKFIGRKHRVELVSRVLRVFWVRSADGPVDFGSVLHELVQCFAEADYDIDLLTDIVASLAAIDSEAKLSSVGAFAAIAIAIARSESRHEPKLALQIISCSPRHAKMSSVVLIFQYIKNIAVTLIESAEGSMEVIEQPLPQHTFIASIAKENKSSGLQKLLQRMIRLFEDCLQLRDVQERLENGTEEDSKFCLSLWQGSLWLHAACQIARNSNKTDTTLWQALTVSVDEIRNEIQSAMPLSLFMASVSRLLENDAKHDMLAEALALVAERVVDVPPDSAEASLFMALLPELSHSLGGREVWTQASTGAYQSALLAIEHIGRVLCLGTKRPGDLDTRMFETVLEKLAETLEGGSIQMNLNNAKFSSVGATHRDLMCSLMLAASTTIRILGVRALPHVPRIMGPLVEALSMANDTEQDHGSKASAPRDMQLAAVRTIDAVAESVPQLFAKYLPELLVNRALLSNRLRSGNDPVLSQAVDALDNCISSGVPARMLIPALENASERGGSNKNLLVLVQMLHKTVEGVSSRDAGSLKSGVFICITTAIDQGGSDLHSEHPLVAEACAALVSFSLKLSEGQLRRVYGALKEWKNEATAVPGASNATKRLAFWAMSASLSHHIKSLFLSSVSIVVEDLSLELNHAVSILCVTKSIKTKGGQKKRKIEESENVPYTSCPHILQQVLLFLERSLRADAREGGAWTKSDEGKRYNLFLEPLLKLLHCNLTSMVSEEVLPTYEDIVEGARDKDEGHIVGCLTALALAAGDEQLWKPLNHAVLEAAGSEGRNEVRIGGLVCLLSLMKTLGEEYMVLLPECLPVLSELLEDSNEEVAGLARDIVTLAEDLLGENLEEALR